MYLHIGGDAVVPYSDLVAVLNCETAKFSDKENNDAKSMIIACSEKKTKIFYTDISTKALISRFECFLKGEAEDVNGIQ